MTPRSFIGKQFDVIRADAVEVGDEIVITTFGSDVIRTVRDVRIIGDDVEIVPDDDVWTEITTSAGNAVVVVSV